MNTRQLTTHQHLIERLRPHCEYILLHAEDDAWAVVNLLEPRIGATVKFIDHPKPILFTGPSTEAVLAKAWKRRP